uniref:Uncharacterized protein n=1 Tax=Coccolithus braarudii TaxID=221442 RepID=A0A7S0Q2C2_9EUKA
MLCCAAKMLAFAAVLGFSVPTAGLVPRVGLGYGLQQLSESRVRCIRLAAAGSLEVTVLSLQEKSEMGLTGNLDNLWLPTQVKAPLAERMPPEASRYVSEGKGKVTVGGESYAVGPNTFVKVQGSAAIELIWTPNEDCDELVLLTPDFWTPGRMAARAALPVVWAGLGVLGLVAVASAITS